MYYSIDEKIQLPEKWAAISFEQAMDLAIIVAQQGAAFVSPNPLVGCVIVDDQHRFLAAGFHEKYGESHAEVNALKKIEDPALLSGATFYVTLEPCAHEGKTPSCAKALAKLPIRKVVYGLKDPNPLVSGAGAQILQDVGIEAIEYQGAFKQKLFELKEVFLKNFMQKKIFVAAKLASSLDGQMALANGDSQWITGEAARQFGHELRSRYDAIMVGKNTILKDDPSLNIRHPKIQKAQKLVILDRSKSIRSKMEKGQRFKFTEVHHPENIIFPTSQTLTEVLEELWKTGIRSVYVEGGAILLSQFFKEGLVDRLHLLMAPTIMGSGLSWTKDLKFNSMNERILLKNMTVKTIGADTYFTGTINVKS